MRYLRQSPVSAEAVKPVLVESPPAPTVLEPCPDEMYQVYMKVFEYAKSPLNPKVEQREEYTRFTVFEKVSFDPAYLGDRMSAALFIPKEGKGPFPVVIHWPGGFAFEAKAFSEYGGGKDTFDYLTKTGRAVVLAAVRGTFDRKWNPEIRAKTTAQERIAMMVKDFRRTIDYLETRPEFDTKKLTYEGLSWGAGLGSIIPSIEQRVRAIVLIGAAFYPRNSPYFNPINLAPRITAPVLIQNGRYDFAVSVEEQLNPLFRLFGTPAKDKSIKLYEAGHAVWMRMEQKRDEIDFLDKVFGPAK
jgi:dienelactone hydrolase